VFDEGSAENYPSFPPSPDEGEDESTRLHAFSMALLEIGDALTRHSLAASLAILALLLAASEITRSAPGVFLVALLSWPIMLHLRQRADVRLDAVFVHHHAVCPCGGRVRWQRRGKKLARLCCSRCAQPEESNRQAAPAEQQVASRRFHVAELGIVLGAFLGFVGLAVAAALSLEAIAHARNPATVPVILMSAGPAGALAYALSFREVLRYQATHASTARRAAGPESHP
jgi:hypothetical protein